tara:strand:- start:323 stop:745 length:423 start_codon:yes stop_codon:yes gene_type:complete
MDLYGMLGQEKTRKTASSGNLSLGKQIANELYLVCEEYLLKTYPQYFMDISGTQIVKRNTKGGDDEVFTIKGHRLVFPLGEKVEVKREGNKHIMENPCSINDIKIYAEGKNTQVGEYILVGGKKTIWNKKQNKLVETTTK